MHRAILKFLKRWRTLKALTLERSALLQDSNWGEVKCFCVVKRLIALKLSVL